MAGQECGPEEGVGVGVGEVMEYQVARRPVHKSVYVAGLKVWLPVKPYPSQRAMMAQIITGLKHRQNCLLESPTGSGKSLALLCSTLAWQKEQKEKAKRYNSLLLNGVTDPDVLSQAAGFSSLLSRPLADDASDLPPTQTADLNELASSGGFFFASDEDDFKTPPPPEVGDNSARYHHTDFTHLGDHGHLNPGDHPRQLKVPKIFIGTRTHKQVQQLVKELRRTAYRDVNMVVLSSRELSCIHPEVSRSSNKIERCKMLTAFPKGQVQMEPQCCYYRGVSSIKTHDLLDENGELEGAWDIEDLVQVGHKIIACPYYAARGLINTAELVLCPYNYLLDPVIRTSMKISLMNHVVVLDEGHNIEDSARSAASFTIIQDHIDETSKHLKSWSESQEYQTLASILFALSGWIDENKDNLTEYTDYSRSGKIYTGTEIIAILDHLGISIGRFEELQRCYRIVTDDDYEIDDKYSLSSQAKKVLEDLFLVLTFLFKENMKHKDDYRVALIKEQVWKKSESIDGWNDTRPGLTLQYSISFWCLNPAVAFSPISAVTHSIILTSGTLSPMSSFQSELGVSFKLHLEANHVIDQSQIFVGSIGEGPRGKSILATYKHTSSWEFQDDLGDLVLKVCETVPGGILCFLPSYSILNKLHDRWKNTGVWDEISKVKEAMTEQRSGKDFEKDLTYFYAAIKKVQAKGRGGVVGGVFFMAVYRGKVSEGLDFADDNARAVIAVGIPYPSVKDIQVDLKKKYNDSFQESRKLLSGNMWYEIQAYRAVNQALGRCIRHRYDWGALLLVDVRFSKSVGNGPRKTYPYTSGLSKWVRNNVVHHGNFSVTMNSLKRFVENMMMNPPQPPKSEEPPATPLKSTAKDTAESLPSDNSDTLEVIDLTHTRDIKGKNTQQPPMMSSLNNTTNDNSQIIPQDKIEYCGAEGKGSPSYYSLFKQRHKSDCDKSSKENGETFIQTKKRQLSAEDQEDLEDFNLTLSPSTVQINKAPPLALKKVRPKKGMVFSNKY